LGVRSDLTPINPQKLLTKSNGPRYTTTWNLQILILNSIELIGTLTHVINITSMVRDIGCYRLPILRCAWALVVTSCLG
jgi:hypothetical protein